MSFPVRKFSQQTMPSFSILCVRMQTLFLNNVTLGTSNEICIVPLWLFTDYMILFLCLTWITFSHLITRPCVSKSHCIQWDFSKILKLVLCFETAKYKHTQIFTLTCYKACLKRNFIQIFEYKRLKLTPTHQLWQQQNGINQDFNKGAQFYKTAVATQLKTKMDSLMQHFS